MEAKCDRTDLDGMTCSNCFHYTGMRCMIPGGGHEETPSSHKCDGHFYRGEDGFVCMDSHGEPVLDDRDNDWPQRED